MPQSRYHSFIMGRGATKGEGMGLASSVLPLQKGGMEIVSHAERGGRGGGKTSLTEWDS